MTHVKNAGLLAMTITGGLALAGLAQMPLAHGQTAPTQQRTGEPAASAVQGVQRSTPPAMPGATPTQGTAPAPGMPPAPGTAPAPGAAQVPGTMPGGTAPQGSSAMQSPAGTIQPGTTGAAPGTQSGTVPGATGSTTAPPPRTSQGTTSQGTTSQAARAAGPAWASQIIGSRVYNDAGESIGEVEDVAVELARTAPGAMTSAPMAVIQVGGFLGIGGRHVSVPLSELRWNAEQERIVMPNATRDTLRARPVYEYSTTRR